MVIVLETEDLELVFIGAARNVERRLAVIRHTSPCDVSLLRVLAGGMREARELHRRFGAHRVRGHWFYRDPIVTEIRAIDTIKLSELATPCPRCRAPRHYVRPRAADRDRLCVSCSQKRRWSRYTPEERASKLAAVRASPAHEDARSERVARFARVRAAHAVCVDCGASLPIQSPNKIRAAADRRCRGCAMRARWRDPNYQHARAAGLARARGRA